MLTAQMSHKRIYHLGHNCFLGKDRLQFLMLQIGKLALQLLHSGSASVRVCMCVCVCVCACVCVCVCDCESGKRSEISRISRCEHSEDDKGGCLRLGTPLPLPSERLVGGRQL